MRLASKFFAATTLVIMALVGVAAWSLLAVDHLVRAHREITDRSLPALQIEVALQEERTARTVADLGRLDPLLTSTAEMTSYREAVAALAIYQELVHKERALL